MAAVDDALDLAAGLVRAVASGRPFATDRERAERHVRRALQPHDVGVEWEESMAAAVRRALELLGPDGRPAHWYRYDPPVTALVPASRAAFAEGALAALSAADGVVLRHGREQNRASNVTPGRRLGVPLATISDPVSAVNAVVALVDEAARSLLADREPRGWRAAVRGRPLGARARELAHAAAVGLMTGLVVPPRGSRPHTVVLVPRPALALRRAPRSDGTSIELELHGESRPAVLWPDGTCTWWWEGVEIPAKVAERVDELAPQEIAAIGNLEVRRLVVERVGWDRFLRDADRVAQDDFGTLWDAGVRLDGARLRLVEVVNATEEPDGSRRRYVLRVPPRVRTAREAVAWTFGFDSADDYLLAAAS